jgi:hypothetical protein
MSAETMIGLSEEARAYIAEGLGAEVAFQLDRFLRGAESRLTAAKPHPETVGHALMLWSARAGITEITGVRIEGIQDLVCCLRSLDPEAVLERYDVHDGRALLTCYRERQTGLPVGYQFVNTPRPDNDALYEALGVRLSPSQRSDANPSAVRVESTQEELRHG